MVNATGWSQLMDGSPIGAAYYMYNLAFVGWFVIILFFVFQIMLYLKLRNVTTNLITGLFFASLYLGGRLGETTTAGMYMMGILLGLELAGVVYFLFSK